MNQSTRNSDLVTLCQRQVAITVFVMARLKQSSYGRALQAIREDEIAAEAMGINTTRYKITAFLVGAFFAGIAGGVYAHFKQYIAPQGFGSRPTA